jgi:NDP-sugar pyrophosphorylase family protein
MSEPMPVVILAGGKGARLHPYTTTLPKPLMPVGEMPVLEIIIRQLQKAGFKDLTVSVGHLHGLIQAYFGDGSSWGVNLRYSLETSPLGTAGPIALMTRPTGSFLVLNGDLLCSIDFAEMVRSHKHSGSIATIATYPKRVQISLGVLETEEGVLKRYVEKPTIDYKISMGIYVFEPRILDFIEVDERLDIPDLIQNLLTAGESVNLFDFDGYWRDIGTMEEYAAADEEFPSVAGSLNFS